MNHIGELKEQHLHAALKAWYAGPDVRVEASIDGGQRGYVIDLVRGDLLIEIQTGNFSSIQRKLKDLVKRYPVRLIYPILLKNGCSSCLRMVGMVPGGANPPNGGGSSRCFLNW